jgi:23S rRNA (uridine2552-2'-O)-methyltransferase
MATNTSGNKELDSYKTGELCINAMNLAKRILNKNGIFLSKIFMGSIFQEINKKAKESFKSVTVYKPLSSKKESKEIYIFCKGMIQNEKFRN